MKVFTFSAQRFDKNAANPYTPSAYSWPSTYTESQLYELKSEIQRLISLLKMETTVYNIETRVEKNGVPYIMEVSPRGGGNRLSEMVRYSTGTDLITSAVRAAVGDTVNLDAHSLKGHWAEIILHAEKSGSFKELQFSSLLKKENIKEIDLWVHEGDMVTAFNGANNAIGTLVLKFDSNDELEKFMENQTQYFKVVVE
jgi:biotin carboxylase